MSQETAFRSRFRSVPALEHPVVLFDGYCKLCSFMVNFVLAWEAGPEIRFASIQSAAGRAMLKSRRITLTDSRTVVFLEGSHVYYRSDAVARIARYLRFPFRWMTASRVIPRSWRDAAYLFLATNRYRWFGMRDACRLPSVVDASRFVEPEVPFDVTDESILLADVESSVAATSSAASTYFRTAREAQAAADILARRVLTPRYWNRWTSLARFDHYSPAGELQQRRSLAVDDFLQVDLAGPSGVDWVRVIAIQRQPTSLRLVLQPSYDPTENPLRTHLTAHFFRREATNTIEVAAHDTELVLSVHGKNEVANVADECADGLRAARNLLIAEAGWFGGQAAHWNAFTRAAVEEVSTGKAPITQNGVALPRTS